MLFKEMPQQVTIVEVGPRDGLQSETQILSAEAKVHFIDLLSQSGLSVIEVGSFVSPKWIPQLANTGEVLEQIQRNPNIYYPVLVPNVTGLSRAVAHEINEIAVFTAASETFAQKNMNCSIAESMVRFKQIMQEKPAHVRVRGYISCIHGCPYEGHVATELITEMTSQLLELGCYQVSLGDTIGVGTASQTEQLLDAVLAVADSKQIAAHFHDTYGQALANCLVAFLKGVTTFDSAVAGLGGCPYAKGASGNLATEDLLYFFSGLGVDTGINQEKLMAASRFICSELSHLPRSKVALAQGNCS